MDLPFYLFLSVFAKKKDREFFTIFSGQKKTP